MSDKVTLMMSRNQIGHTARVIFLASVPFTAHFFAEREREDEDDGGIGASGVREKSASVIAAERISR